MQNLTNTNKIQTNILPLLQTKLGFFTNKDFNSATLRYILEVFPILVKEKGSIDAIKKLLNAFIKINNIRSVVTVSYVEKATILNDVSIPDHTVVVGFGGSSSVKNVDILKEVMKYILPAGFFIYFYYYVDISDQFAPDQFASNTNAKILFVSNNANSLVRSSKTLSYGEPEYEVMGAVDSVEIATANDMVSEHYIGKYNSTGDITAPAEGDIAIIDRVCCKYNSGNWIQFRFRGTYSDLSYVDSPEVNDLALYDDNYYIYTLISGEYKWVIDTVLNDIYVDDLGVFYG